MSSTSTFDKNEPQYKMSDEFARCLMAELKKHNIKFSQFCDIVGVNKYYLRKVVDRNVQMSCYLSLLETIAEMANIKNIKLYK